MYLQRQAALISLFFLSCSHFSLAETASSRSFTVFEDPNVYAGFPVIFQMNDRIVVSFMYQDLEAIRKSKLHPHYAPAKKTYYAQTADFKEWKITDTCPRLSDLLDITSSLAPIDSESFVNLAFRYKPGTKETEPEDIRIFKNTCSTDPVFTASLKEMTGIDNYMHDVRKAADGGFLAAGYFVEKDKPSKLDFPDAQQYLDHWPEGCRRAAVAFFKGSADGKTWRQLGAIHSAAPYGLCEPSFVEYDNGRIVCLIRAEWDHKFKNLFPGESHFDNKYYAYFLCQSESNDGGKTWSKPKQLELWGHPPYLLKLKSGNLLMVYGHRRPPYTVRSIISRDQGRTWDKSTLKTLYTFEPGGYDLGYPVAVQLSDGRIFCCFYGYTPASNKEQTARGIYGCLFAE